MDMEAVMKAAMEAALTAVARPKPNFAGRIFEFCMKSVIALGCCYFVMLAYIAATQPQLERLLLLPFFGVAVTAPLYAAALMHEHGWPAVSQEALRKESERLWKVHQQQNL